MEKYIIDTNFFVNLEIKSGFGKNPIEIINNFIEVVKKLKNNKKAEFYMVPEIVDELKTFFDKPEIVDELLNVVTIKTPDLNSISFSANVFYKLINEIRERSYKGLKVAEELVFLGAQRSLGKSEVNKIEFQKMIGETVKNLRDRYRQATRVNFLDSTADFELIALAKEIDGFLITADEGLLRWGRTFGIKEIEPQLFKKRLETL